ncbi:MAG: ribonuclease R [Lachnospiraceae bacterium]|jgi:ribonuclease R
MNKKSNDKKIKKPAKTDKKIPETNDLKFEKISRLIIELMSSDLYVPMKAKQLAALLNLDKDKRGLLQKVLDNLIDEGKIAFNKKGEYRIRKNKERLLNNSITGVFMANPKGFGFVRPENGTDEDIFILGDDINGAMDGDIVKVRFKSGHSRGEHDRGTVIKVISRANTSYVGRYIRRKDKFYVTSDNPKIIKSLEIDTKNSIRCETGDKVVAIITRYSEGNGHPFGRVVKKLGNENDPGIDILSKIISSNISSEFPPSVLREASDMPVSVVASNYPDRKDLRSQICVTIDGEDAKDLDDAVSVEKTADGYTLWVHIADVSHYVKTGSALDKEAFHRGTSIYLPDRVVPMLPRELSNGICSLNEGCDRLVLTCEMHFDDKGEKLSYSVYEAIINVSKRMNYSDVNAVIEESDDAACVKYEKYLDLISCMAELSKKIRELRHRRGAIDFDFPEAKLILDENGAVTDIKIRESNSATQLIEDFMLSANESIAAEYYNKEIPFVYRVHDVPDMDSIENIIAILHDNGIKNVKSGHRISASEINDILEIIEGHPAENMIKRLLLRAMPQAKYSTENTGHFALCADDYCHFTSPIRRYPDLMIHRIIKCCIHGKSPYAAVGNYHESLENVAHMCSLNERSADALEREVDDMKKAEYALTIKGMIFEGVVSGVTSWGFYVELPSTIEGLVSNASLHDDYYDFDDKKKQLVGRKHGKVIRMGDKVRVKVKDAHKEDGTIDFKFKDFAD